MWVSPHNHSSSSYNSRNFIPRKHRVLERTQAVLLAISGIIEGKLFLLDRKSKFTIGRAKSCDICLIHTDISQRHARLAITETGEVVITDLATTHGTYVDGIAISHHTLADGAIIQIGPTDALKFTYINHLEKSFHLNQYRKTIYDDLTGAFNRRYFLMALRQELAYAIHYRESISLILVDIDRFKQINDSQGHVVGDGVLRRMVAVIQGNLRKEDILARYGGEEFGIILRGKNVEQAHVIANRVRHSVERTAFNNVDKSFYITISAGVASYDQGYPSNGVLEMLTQADKQLYRAKAMGGNHTF
uniref:diguanylate cyclase n=1 Tax=Candidatus Kentrum sp. TUN TaxID=2126343 RepID=A0A450ZKR7_9GAMM|nr:MAG: diguanylate cyclase (GGDEF) domain-containing protein [Candidatus Kentron sp. TUN]VFK55281.1 MAG: diguanylate cyclase (GGDEF) domain-containing protein [Candidatus Kentron sp. TUN]VFK56648.1 MAG: diguanylate cyclase (GGDEF) domain-containing protein [Candidatus Kentron sp. TUN]